MPDSDYSALSRPYSDTLARATDLAVQTGSMNGSLVLSNSAGATPTGNASMSATGTLDTSGGSVQPASVTSPQAMTDIFVQSSIQSQNWQPKKSGFYISGLTGYAEFNSVFIASSVTAIVGIIGGFLIGADYIKDAADSFGLASTVTGGDDVRFWAGTTFANRVNAPFRVTKGGAVTGNNVTLNSPLIAGSLALGSLIDIQNWHYHGDFESVDANTVSWTADTLYFSDTQTFAIAAGTTGTMTAETHIYFDTTSPGIFKTTLNPATAVGANKILICVANPSPTGATFMALNNNSVFINGAEDIATASITANQIAANTITANQLSTSLLYAGIITLDVNGAMLGGQTNYDTGTGFFLGYSGGTYKLSIGNSSGNRLTWDGSALTIVGNITASSGTIGGFTIGATTLTGGALTLDASIGTITGGTIQTASLGERIMISSSTKRLNFINASGDTTMSMHTGGTFAQPLLEVNPQDDDRGAISVLTSSSITSTVVDITNQGTGLSLSVSHLNGFSGHDAVAITNQGTGRGISIQSSGVNHGMYISATPDTTSGVTNAAVLYLDNTGGHGNGLFINDTNGDATTASIKIGKFATSSTNMTAITINNVNAGVGNVIGIDLGGLSASGGGSLYYFSFNGDTTIAGGQVGRIPVRVGGVLRYLHYFNG